MGRGQQHGPRRVHVPQLAEPGRQFRPCTTETLNDGVGTGGHDKVVFAHQQAEEGVNPDVGLLVVVHQDQPVSNLFLREKVRM